MTEPPKSRGLRLRPAQVLATALAALTGAYLASRLGVYGTVVGAGVISVLSTIATEVYVRSLDRTKEAALRKAARAKVLGAGIDTTSPAVAGEHIATPTTGESATGELTMAGAAGTHPAPLAELSDSAVVPRENETATGSVDSQPVPGRFARVRWPLVAAGSLAAFAVAMVAITGLEATTGSRFSGGTGSTLGALVVPDRTAEEQPDESSGGPQRAEDGGASVPSVETTPSPTPTPSDGPDPATGSSEETGTDAPATGETENPAETETPEPIQPTEPSETPEPTPPADEPPPQEPGAN